MIELVTSLLAQDKVSPEQAASILQQMLPSETLSHLQAHLNTPRASIEEARMCYRWGVGACNKLTLQRAAAATVGGGLEGGAACAPLCAALPRTLHPGPRPPPICASPVRCPLPPRSRPRRAATRWATAAAPQAPPPTCSCATASTWVPPRRARRCWRSTRPARRGPPASAWSSWRRCRRRRTWASPVRPIALLPARLLGWGEGAGLEGGGVGRNREPPGAASSTVLHLQPQPAAAWPSLPAPAPPRPRPRRRHVAAPRLGASRAPRLVCRLPSQPAHVSGERSLVL